MQELSIIGYYLDAEQFQAGHGACRALATVPGVPRDVRDLAASNLAFYEKRAA
jgi:hypothetical protein